MQISEKRNQFINFFHHNSSLTNSNTVLFSHFFTLIIGLRKWDVLNFYLDVLKFTKNLRPCA